MAKSTTYSITDDDGVLSALHCEHCGDSLVPGEIVTSNGKHFCCNGCSSVHALLNGLGLGDFYKLRDSQNPDNILPATDADIKESYNYLNTQEFKELYTSAYEPLTMNFYIEGIQCAACLWLIEKIPEFTQGVSHVSLNMSENTATVEFNEDGYFSKFPEIARKLGYKAHPLKIGSDESARALKQKEQRTSLIRLSVAAVCAGNIMLLSAAIYSGAGGAFKEYFGILNLALTIPVVTYCAYPFYKSVWSSLRMRRATVDIPVAFVILIGFVLSTVSFFEGSDNVYFDSITAFIFLLLASRYFLKMVQDRAAGREPLSQTLFSSNRVLLRDENSKEYSLMPIERITNGSLIKLKKGERVPVDGELQSASADLNLSVLTGENIPVTVLKDSLIYAGSVLESGTAVIKAEKTGNETRIGKILDSVNRNYQNKFNFSTQSDRYATSFTLAVGIVAIVSFIALASLYSPGEALRRVIAFILIACPCAFVFALPLSLGLSIKTGVRKGYLVKDTAIFDKLAKIKNVFFDKTGTLTKGVFKILKWQTDLLSESDKAAVLAIERESSHPVARAIVSFLSDQELPLYKAEEFRILPSKGVQARVNGSLYSLVSESIEQNSQIGAIISTKIIVRKDGQEISEILLGDTLKEDAKYTLDELKAKGLNVSLLSGDKKSSVMQTGTRLGIADRNIHWEKSPEEKAEIIKDADNGPSIMIGDGLNDAPAISSADVGIAIQGSVEESLKVSDAYILNNDLYSVLELINQASTVKETLVRNTRFSVVYNIAAGVFALLGFISPLIAAILMPLSSILLIGSSIYGLKMPQLKEVRALR